MAWVQPQRWPNTRYEICDNLIHSLCCVQSGQAIEEAQLFWPVTCKLSSWMRWDSKQLKFPLWPPPKFGGYQSAVLFPKVSISTTLWFFSFCFHRSYKVPIVWPKNIERCLSRCVGAPKLGFWVGSWPRSTTGGSLRGQHFFLRSQWHCSFDRWLARWMSPIIWFWLAIGFAEKWWLVL